MKYIPPVTIDLEDEGYQPGSGIKSTYKKPINMNFSSSSLTYWDSIMEQGKVQDSDALQVALTLPIYEEDALEFYNFMESDQGPIFLEFLKNRAQSVTLEDWTASHERSASWPKELKDRHIIFWDNVIRNNGFRYQVSVNSEEDSTLRFISGGGMVTLPYGIFNKGAIRSGNSGVDLSWFFWDLHNKSTPTDKMIERITDLTPNSGIKLGIMALQAYVWNMTKDNADHEEAWKNYFSKNYDSLNENLAKFLEYGRESEVETLFVKDWFDKFIQVKHQVFMEGFSKPNIWESVDTGMIKMLLAAVEKFPELINEELRFAGASSFPAEMWSSFFESKEELSLRNRHLLDPGSSKRQRM